MAPPPTAPAAQWVREKVTGEEKWTAPLPLSNPLFASLLSSEDACVAGGVFKSVLLGQQVKDVDVFFRSEEAFQAAVARAEKTPGWHYRYRTENCVAYSVQDEDFFTAEVELICAVVGPPEAILESFDFIAVCMALFEEGGELYLLTHPDARAHVEAKEVVFTESGPRGNPLERVGRYYSYGFQVPQETFELALRAVCAEEGCAEVGEELPPWGDFIASYSRWCSSVGTSNAARGSYGLAHRATNDALHFFFHLYGGKLSADFLNGAQAPQVEEALAALHPQAPAAFSFRSAELLAFSYHLPALERLQALPLEARGELLALMAGSFLTREKASWENMQVGLKLGEALLQWEDGEGALGFLRALGKLEAPLLTYGDWLKAFELGLPPHILPDFLKILFGTETVLDWFTDRRGAYSLARQVLFGLGSAEDSRKPPF